MVEFQAGAMTRRHAETMFSLGWIFGIVFGMAGGVSLGYFIWG